MEWSELRAAIRTLQTDKKMTPTAFARSGASLIHHALSTMYIGDPETLRKVAGAVVQARPSVVALRNVGVAVVRTAIEARSGDRMAAAARAAQRLGRLLEQTPNALGRRGQSLLGEQSTVVTLGYSSAVHSALARGYERIERVIAIESTHQNQHLANEFELEETVLEKVPPNRVGDSLARAHVILLGCSAFLADGSLLAEKGALELVESAAAQNVQVHFFADTLKLAPWLPPDKQAHDTGMSWELVPPNFVDHVVTEDGIRRPHQLLAAAADLGPQWRNFEGSS